MVTETYVDNLRGTRQIGLRPTDPERYEVALRMSRFLETSALTYPSSVTRMDRVAEWIMGRNLDFGTCGPVSVANLMLFLSTLLGDVALRFTEEEIFDLYARSGNPNFDPTTGADDNGVDMTVMLSELVRNGIGFGDRNVKALAYAAIHQRVEIQWTASNLFGGLLWGADLQQAQDQQMDLKPPKWEYVAGSRPWGGHAIFAVGDYRDRPGTADDETDLVTWQEVVKASSKFIEQCVSERYLVLTPWHLGSRQFVANTDLATLASDYKYLTGKEFPSYTPPPVITDPPPVMPPVGTNTAEDLAMAKTARAWLTSRGL